MKARKEGKGSEAWVRVLSSEREHSPLSWSRIPFARGWLIVMIALIVDKMSTCCADNKPVLLRPLQGFK
jgi:hypothetical protein